MQVRVLGGISVCTAPERIEQIHAPRPRLILAMLAGRAGRPVLEDQLIEGIWGDHPPSSARTALQTYLSALRDVLEPERPRRSPGRFIATEGGGYVLDPDATQLDLALFERDVSAGITLVDTDATEAIRLLDLAIGRWGEPFAELASEPWAAGVVARLRERHSNALEARYGLALHLGQQDHIVEDLRSAVDVYPYRERLAGQLMLSLYRLGDQVGALDVARSVRRRLLDELGLDPSPELAELESGILHHDPQLRDLESAAAAPDTARSARRQLSPIIGRDRLIASVCDTVRAHRVVSLVGAGGVGKSAVAAHAVAQLIGDFEVTQATDVAELPDLTTSDMLRSVAASLGVTEHALAPLDETICDAVGSTPTIVVVETAEAAPDAVADLIDRLNAAPGLHVLVTSQVPVRAIDEYVVRIPPLDLDEAVALLTSAHHQSQPHDQAVLRDICEQLDRLPLALELAASQLQNLGAPETLRQLKRGLVTEADTSGRPNRQRSSMRAAEWGIERASADERRLLERLAAHTSPFTLRTARHIWGHRSDPDDVERALVGLVDRSLVHRIDDDADFPRYRLLDTVRTTVRAASDQQTEHALRLTEAVIETAQASLFGTPSVLSLDELIGELVPALDRLHADNDARELVLAGCLALFWVSRSRVAEGSELLDRALATHRNVPPMLYGPTAGIASFLAYCSGNMLRTRELLAAMDQVSGDWMVPAVSSTVAASVAFLDRRYDDASERYAETLTYYDEPTPPKLLNLWLGANSLWYAGRRSDALAQYQRLRREADSVGDVYNISLALRFEAMVGAQIGEIDRSWRLVERSLSMAIDLGDDASIGQAEVAAAVVAFEADALADAERHALDAIKATLRPYDLFTQRAAPPIAAAAAMDRGDAETAAVALGWYLDYLDRTGQPPAVATARLASEVESATRAALGRAVFARTAAGGAAMRLRELHDRLVGAAAAAG